MELSDQDSPLALTVPIVYDKSLSAHLCLPSTESLVSHGSTGPGEASPLSSWNIIGQASGQSPETLPQSAS